MRRAELWGDIAPPNTTGMVQSGMHSIEGDLVHQGWTRVQGSVCHLQDAIVNWHCEGVRIRFSSLSPLLVEASLSESMAYESMNSACTCPVTWPRTLASVYPLSNGDCAVLQCAVFGS